MSLTAEALLDMYAPQFAANANKANWLLLGRDSISSSIMGTAYEEAVALFAAHRMTLAARMSGDAGAISSKSEGSLSVSYASAGSRTGYDDLNQTQYGVRLLSLMVGMGATLDVTSAGDDLFPQPGTYGIV